MKNATTERPAGAPRPAPTFSRLDGPAVAADPEPFARAYQECYAHAAQLSDHSDPPIGDRLVRHGDRPGFELLAAMDGERVAGYIYGYTLPVDTLWWDGLTPAPAPELTREWPGRTVGVCELLVGRPWRRSQLGAQLFDGFLRGRTEERAAALVAEGNDVVLDRCEKYGFAHVGRMEPYPGWRPHHMVVRSLRTG